MLVQLQMLSSLQLHSVRVTEAFDELQLFVQHRHIVVGGGLVEEFDLCCWLLRSTKNSLDDRVITVTSLRFCTIFVCIKSHQQPRKASKLIEEIRAGKQSKTVSFGTAMSEILL